MMLSGIVMKKYYKEMNERNWWRKENVQCGIMYLLKRLLRICDTQRKPINNKDRARRIEGKKKIVYIHIMVQLVKSAT